MNGAELGLAYSLPFAGILLSIAVLPLLAPAFWHAHFGKVTLFWTLLLVVPLTGRLGTGAMAHELVHVFVGEYLPFVVLLLALFVVSSGIVVRGDLRGRPSVNTAILAVGTLLASLMGTTGASILLVRPLIRANLHRRHHVHVFVFFIFLVGNVGGALTPLGDPPLFLGFLKGVDFFWPARHLAAPALLLSVGLLALFYVIDRHYHRREPGVAEPMSIAAQPIAIAGGGNFLLLAAIVGTILLSGTWKPGIHIALLGTDVPLQNLLRDLLLLAIAALSWRLTPRTLHAENAFSWAPIVEIAKLFAGIFVTILPVIAILQAGSDGALAGLIGLSTRADGTPNPAAYFWLTGILSAFLDNAPTYLVFFNLAGGDAAALMTSLSSTLMAISAGAVFMGACTYIGNAPNFMIKAIAEDRGIAMPSFFGFMAWSGAILIPLFVMMTLLFFA